jgi:ligand-binding SRPBCC domain-containing protein
VQEIVLDFRVFRARWEAEVTRVEAPRLVEDVLRKGLFRKWRHQHRFEAHDDGARLTDAVQFRLLPTVAGEFVEYWTVRPALLLMFRMRHRATHKALADHASG